MDELKCVYSNLIDQHRAWHKPFGRERLAKWENVLDDNPEAAICEASTQKLLSGQGIKVEPHEDMSTGGSAFSFRKVVSESLRRTASQSQQ